MQEILSRVLDMLRDAWRFRWYALLLAWLLAICGWLYVCYMPSQYEVQARVHIDTQSALKPLLHGLTVEPNYNDKIDLLIGTVLSQPHLEQIARNTGMNINATTSKAKQAMLAGLANKIDIRNAGRRNINLFSIAYTSHNADKAQAVVQQVINIMTEMALGNQTRGTARASQFLQHQVKRYKAHIDDLQKEIATYKKNHADLLPAGGYVAQLQNLQNSLTQLESQLSMTEDRRNMLTGAGGSRTISPDQSPQVQSIDHQIATKQGQLQQMLEHYTPKYPDVVSLKQDIARLKSNRQKAIADARAHPQRAAAAGASANRGQISSLNVQLNSLKSAITRKQNQLNSLKANSNNMTNAESHLTELTRNYNAAESQFQNLLARLYKAQLTSEVDQGGSGMKFHVIDPPVKPAAPTGPPRVKLMTAALVASLIGGAAFAFFLSQIRPVFITRRALTEATGLPVLGSVSMASTIQESMRRQTALALFVVGLATLMLGYLAAVSLAPVGARLVPSLLGGQWL
jgi:polysaccharide chain length determinant protein (PEP-CTERM system associated)